MTSAFYALAFGAILYAVFQLIEGRKARNQPADPDNPDAPAKPPTPAWKWVALIVAALAFPFLAIIAVFAVSMYL